ncbi:hypothetical protein IW138_005878 [Coemansia sp. RSA 986]|nr:hypothetical protein IW138_005878 [Coemansia sp. RSA 986]
MKFARHLLTAAIGLTGTVLSAVIQDVRVTNGTFSPQGQAPYFVQVLIDDGGGIIEHCGGTLIDQTTVITAAHCVYDFDNEATYSAKGITIIYGNVQALAGKRVGATSVNVHPLFTPSVNLHNDIAVIQIPKIPLQPDYVETIPIFNGDIEPQEQMQIFGWGVTLPGGTSNNLSTSLLTQEVYISEPQNCQVIDPTYMNADGSFICVDNNYNVGVDVCQGDSGTGTIINSGGKPYIAGLVSYGTDAQHHPTCGQARSFGIYTRTNYFIPWIESIIGHSVVSGPVTSAPTAATTQTSTPTPTPTSSMFCIFGYCL